LLGAYLETQPAPDRARTYDAYVRRLALSGLAATGGARAMGAAAALVRGAAGFDGELSRQLYLPEYARLFRDGDLLKTDKVNFDEETARKIVVDDCRALLRPGRRTSPPMVQISQLTSVPYEVKDNRLLLPESAFLIFRQGNTAYEAEILVTVDVDLALYRTKHMAAVRAARIDVVRARSLGEVAQFGPGMMPPGMRGPAGR
jgi:hypothetical protein